MKPYNIDLPFSTNSNQAGICQLYKKPLALIYSTINTWQIFSLKYLIYEIIEHNTI